MDLSDQFITANFLEPLITKLPTIVRMKQLWIAATVSKYFVKKLAYHGSNWKSILVFETFGPSSFTMMINTCKDVLVPLVGFVHQILVHLYQICLQTVQRCLLIYDNGWSPGLLNWFSYTHTTDSTRIDKGTNIGSKPRKPKSLGQLFFHWCRADMQGTMGLKKHPLILFFHRYLSPAYSIFTQSMQFIFMRRREKVFSAFAQWHFIVWVCSHLLVKTAGLRSFDHSEEAHNLFFPSSNVASTMDLDSFWYTRIITSCCCCQRVPFVKIDQMLEDHVIFLRFKHHSIICIHPLFQFLARFMRACLLSYSGFSIFIIIKLGSICDVNWISVLPHDWVRLVFTSWLFQLLCRIRIWRSCRLLLIISIAFN